MMKIDGNCLCGHIRYEAVIDPSMVAICHCTDCQVHSGTAYGVVVGVVDQQFNLLHGTLKVYDKTADSGTIRSLAFCPECGTRIHASTPGDNTKFFGLRVGTVRQRSQLNPTVQAWCGSALDWVDDLSGIPRPDQ